MVLLTVFSLYVAFYGWEIFYDSFARGRTTGSLLDLPAWIAELPVAVCFLFLAVQAVLEIVKLLSGAPILRGASE